MLGPFKRLQNKAGKEVLGNVLVKPRLDFVKLKQESEKMIKNIHHRGLQMPKWEEKMDTNHSTMMTPDDLVKELIRLKDLEVQLEKELNSYLRTRNIVSDLSLKDKDVHNTKDLKSKIQECKTTLANVTQKRETLSWYIPNWTHPNVATEGSFKIVDQSRLPKKENVLPIEIPISLVDFASGSRTTGAKFATFRGPLVFLELALVQFALHRLDDHGFLATLPPDLIRTELIEGCGFAPRDDASQIYHLQDTTPSLSLAGTSEIPIASSLSGCTDINPNEELPIRLGAFSHCFRREAGTKASGLYRLHQFSKVEMFSFCYPENSAREQEMMIEIQKGICDDLGLHWRLLDMASIELGASAYRKYDVEVWMPMRKEWGEVASISDCTDYQARRLNIKYKDAKGSSFIHTVNGTALAIPRVILSLLETHMRADGSGVDIPKVLAPYLGGTSNLFIPFKDNK